MVEVPEELKKFNIKIVYTGVQAKTPNCILRPVLEELLTDMRKDFMGEDAARDMAKRETERTLKGR